MSRIIVCAAIIGLLASWSTGVKADPLPPIMASSSNAVPGCVTPGRMMAFLKSRNTRLDQRYDLIASDYMKHGEELGVRWDVAFFQMLVETANLRYTGDVRPEQNNFAGLGATGNGERGESFRDVSSGVRAHLEHVAMYAGHVVDNPVAERTRKVQEWGVLTKWQRSIRGPMTFTHLTRKWSPGDRGYSNDIKAINDLFFSGYCNIADPRPELIGGVRGEAAGADRVAAVVENDRSAEDLVAKTIAKQKIADVEKSALGATSIANQPPAKPFTVLNSSAADKPAQDAAPAVESGSGSDISGKATKTAALSGGALKSAGKAAADKVKAAEAGAGNCRVWTASYGGAKAVIIKAQTDGLTNYTVLDVNKGKEKRETEAYIAAYAKGGKQIAEFDSSRAALDKAFAMCPES